MNLIQDIVKKRASHSAWRRDLHAHPELAYEERRTAEFVERKLADFDIPIERGIGKTGVVGTITAGSGDRRIGLRADMDALPMLELNTFDHRSRNEGVMHACGHDGHTTMLLAAAEYLARNKDFDGTVDLIFQPAEEGEAGAKAMMDDGLFDRFPVDAVFGLHNWPGTAVGEMGVRVGAMLAAMDVFEVKIIGTGGHGALPHLTVDPILIGSQIVQAWQGIVSRNVNPIDSAVVSVTQFHAGDAWAVIPNEVVLRGTARSFKPAVREMLQRRMKEILDGICAAHGCTNEWWYEERFPPTVNTEKETHMAAAAGAAILGAEHVDTAAEPCTGSEDFGYMLAVKPGCYAWIGNGPGDNGCLLHSPHFDFNDDIIPIGASYWVTLVQQILSPPIS